MKRGVFAIFILIILILISNVIAYQSTITIKTGIPNQEIVFKACDPSTGKTLENGEFRQKSDAQGKVVFEYNLEPVLIKMSFMAWGGSSYLTFLNGKQAIFLNNIILDEFVDVDLNKEVPDFKTFHNESNENIEGVVAKVEVSGETNEMISENLSISNNTSNSVTETEKIPETQKTNSLTGAVISKGKDIFTSVKTYLILGFILVLFGVILLAGRIKKKGSFKAIKIIKMSEILGNKEKSRYDDEEIAHAEKKLREVQEELENLKNKKSKIKEIQERIKKDKEELRRLGED